MIRFPTWMVMVHFCMAETALGLMPSDTLTQNLTKMTNNNNNSSATTTTTFNSAQKISKSISPLVDDDKSQLELLRTFSLLKNISSDSNTVVSQPKPDGNAVESVKKVDDAQEVLFVPRLVVANKENESSLNAAVAVSITSGDENNVNFAKKSHVVRPASESYRRLWRIDNDDDSNNKNVDRKRKSTKLPHDMRRPAFPAAFFERYEDADRRFFEHTFEEEKQREETSTQGNIGPDQRTMLENAIEYGLLTLKELVEVREPHLYRMGLYLDKNEPAVHVANFGSPSKKALALSRWGYAATEASKKYAKNFQDTYGRQLDRLNFLSEGRLLQDDECPLGGTPRCPPASRRYRTADGTCNNLAKPWRGASLLPMQRFLPPVYEDGIQQVRRSVLNEDLPSARDVSSIVHKEENIELQKINLMLMQWGQLIDHDITSTVKSRGFNNSVPRCCDRGGLGMLPPELLHPSCLPISVSPSDQFLSPLGIRCMEFTRSAPSTRINCDLGYREQINQVTSFIDASTIYGSDLETADSMRTFRGGKLMYAPPGGPPSELCRSGALSAACLQGGDGRFTEQPGLTALHTVWLRYHNKLATIFGQINSHWSDEKIYQETRKVTSALIQHITYREFLPIVLGKEVVELFELNLLKKDYYKGYDQRVNPNVANAFSTAAFRFGHSLVQNSFIRADIQHRPLFDNVSLHEEQENVENIWSKGSIDRLILGFCNQPSQRRDEFICEELTNHLFQSRNFPFGMDLAAINIQRGRDHGLPPYTSWRQPCHLSPITSWSHLDRIMDPKTVDRLKFLYQHVDDIDLFTGGLAEKPVRGGLVGPTFACIIAQQFLNLRKGDRFWYENGGFENSFTPAQLQQLRHVTFSHVLCQTLTEIETIQPFVFLMADSFRNARMSCDSDLINNFDLRPWLEEDVFSNSIDDSPVNTLTRFGRRRDRKTRSEVTDKKLTPGRTKDDDSMLRTLTRLTKTQPELTNKEPDSTNTRTSSLVKYPDQKPELDSKMWFKGDSTNTDDSEDTLTAIGRDKQQTEPKTTDKGPKPSSTLLSSLNNDSDPLLRVDKYSEDIDDTSDDTLTKLPPRRDRKTRTKSTKTTKAPKPLRTDLKIQIHNITTNTVRIKTNKQGHPDNSYNRPTYNDDAEIPSNGGQSPIEVNIKIQYYPPSTSTTTTRRPATNKRKRPGSSSSSQNDQQGYDSSLSYSSTLSRPPQYGYVDDITHHTQTHRPQDIYSDDFSVYNYNSRPMTTKRPTFNQQQDSYYNGYNTYLSTTTNRYEDRPFSTSKRPYIYRPNSNHYVYSSLYNSDNGYSNKRPQYQYQPQTSSTRFPLYLYYTNKPKTGSGYSQQQEDLIDKYYTEVLDRLDYDNLPKKPDFSGPQNSYHQTQIYKPHRKNNAGVVYPLPLTEVHDKLDFNTDDLEKKYVKISSVKGAEFLSIAGNSNFELHLAQNKEGDFSLLDDVDAEMTNEEEPLMEPVRMVEVDILPDDGSKWVMYNATEDEFTMMGPLQFPDLEQNVTYATELPRPMKTIVTTNDSNKGRTL